MPPLPKLAMRADLDFDPNDYYSIAQFCDLAGFSRQYFHERFVQRGEGPETVQYRIGKTHRVLIPTGDGDRWLTRYWLEKARREHFTKRISTPTAKKAVEGANHAY